MTTLASAGIHFASDHKYRIVDDTLSVPQIALATRLSFLLEIRAIEYLSGLKDERRATTQAIET